MGYQIESCFQISMPDRIAMSLIICGERGKMQKNRMRAVAFQVQVITLALTDADVESARPASY
jgi:hypothetical protein